MGHDAVTCPTLGGVDGLDPAGANVTVDDAVHVEGQALAGPFGGGQHTLVGVDRDDGCGSPVDPLGGVVVAGELDAVAGKKLLGDLGVGLGLVRAALAGVAGDRLPVGAEQNMLLQRPPRRPNERRKLTSKLDEKPGDPQFTSPSIDVSAYDDEISAVTRDEGMARQLATLPGIGVINTTGAFCHDRRRLCHREGS